MSAVVTFNIIIAFLFIAIFVMRIFLLKNLQRSLYYYRNVTLLAGILFATVLLIALYAYLISCLLDTKSLTLRFMFKEFISFPDKFSIFAIPIFAIICLLVLISNIALIKHEGLRPKNVLGILLAVVFIGGSLGNYYLEKFITNKVMVATGLDQYNAIVTFHTYLHLFFDLIICYFECFFVGTLIMGYLAAKQKPVYDKGYAIILGCAIDKKGGLLPLLKERTNRAIRFAWDQERATGKAVKYIPSGGQGPDEVISEGSAMELYLLSHGADTCDIIAEKQSRSTYENFRFSKRIIDEIDPGARVCFVTTNYHMLRSGIIAKDMGYDFPEGISSRTKWYFWPNGFVREFFAIVLMHKNYHLAMAALFAVGCIILGFIAFAYGIS